jgi:hypothetical protein
MVNEGMANEGMSTRRRRINYYLLNDGSDEEEMGLDRTSEPPEVPAAIADNIPLSPSEPDTQTTETSPAAAVPAPRGFRRERPAPATEWIWSYFEVTTVDREWTVKRTGKRKLFDRDIRCAYVDENTNVRCTWETTDSARQTATANMKSHLAKHGINPPATENPAPSQKQPSIANLLAKKANLTVQQLLDENILRWVVTSKQPFTIVEEPDFQQVFRDIPGVSPPFSSRHTLRQRICNEFNKQRLQLKHDLATTCSTIALSLDAWTSTNSLPVLAIVGHWLTEKFEYRQKVLEFIELQGAHSGENLAATVEACLVELDLVPKLLTITGDNAGGNETLISDCTTGLWRGSDSRGRQERTCSSKA